MRSPCCLPVCASHPILALTSTVILGTHAGPL
jgi:hypothetical protein